MKTLQDWIERHQNLSMGFVLFLMLIVEPVINGLI